MIAYLQGAELIAVVEQEILVGLGSNVVSARLDRLRQANELLHSFGFESLVVQAVEDLIQTVGRPLGLLLELLRGTRLKELNFRVEDLVNGQGVGRNVRTVSRS